MQDQVDEEQRVDVVGDVGPVDCRQDEPHLPSPPARLASRAFSTTASTAASNAARTPCSSSAATPAAVTPPGEVTVRLRRRRRVAVAQQLRRPCHRRDAPARAACRAVEALPHAGVRECLDHQREEAGPHPEIAVAASIRRSSTGISSPSSPNRSSRSRSSAVVDVPAARVAEGPGPDLRRDVRHEAQHGGARTEGLLDRGDRSSRRGSRPPAGRDPLTVTRISSATAVKRAGLDREHEHVGAARRARGWNPLARGRRRSASDLARSASTSLKTIAGPGRSRATPSQRQRRGHVAGADEPYDQSARVATVS